MSSGEFIIILLLGVIASILYQIAKQLSYLTGRKIRWTFPRFHLPTPLPKKKPEKEKLSN